MKQLRELAVIDAGESLSAALDMSTYRLVRIEIPPDWTAANITIQVSSNGIDYLDLYDDSGVEYTITAVANRAIFLSLNALVAARYVKFRSGTSATPVVQAARRYIPYITVA